MSEAVLRFEETPYDKSTVNNLLLHFREQGYVVVPHVFVRDSVDTYREQVERILETDAAGRIVVPGDAPLAIAPTYAPRLRQMLPGALSHASMPPHPALFEVAWLVSAAEPQPRPHGWHKDRDHEGMPGNEYHYPNDVHIGMYFEDMTPEHGPTQIIPRSHKDQTRSPYSGHDIESFLPRKEDVVLWDQRAWHRGTARTLPGHRLFALFGFYGVPVYGVEGRPMPPAQRAAWLSATAPSEQVFYGGPYKQASKDEG